MFKYIKYVKLRRVIVLSSILTILYAWILGIFGLYGEQAMLVCRLTALVCLKYGGILLGLFLLWFVPIRVLLAMARNNAIAYEAKVKAEEQRKVEKLKKEEQIKTALAQHYDKLG